MGAEVAALVAPAVVLVVVVVDAVDASNELPRDTLTASPGEAMVVSPALAETCSADPKASASDAAEAEVVEEDVVD